MVTKRYYNCSSFYRNYWLLLRPTFWILVYPFSLLQYGRVRAFASEIGQELRKHFFPSPLGRGSITYRKHIISLVINTDKSHPLKYFDQRYLDATSRRLARFFQRWRCCWLRGVVVFACSYGSPIFIHLIWARPASWRRHGEVNLPARRYDAEALHDARVAADLRRDILFSRVLLSSSQFHKWSKRKAKQTIFCEQSKRGSDLFDICH